MWQLALAATLIGLPTGAFGIGGFLLPASLMILFFISPSIAVSSSLIAFIPGTIVAAWSRWKKNHIHIVPAVTIGAASLLGSPFGVSLNTVLPNTFVRRVLGIVLLCLGGRMIWNVVRSVKAGNRTGHNRHRRGNGYRTWVVYVVLGMIAGILTGLTGVGGPVITVPALLALGMSAHYAIGTSLLAAIFPLIGSSATYVMQGEITWDVTLISLVGTTLGMLIGTYYGTRWPRNMVEWAIAYLTLGSGIWLCI